MSENFQKALEAETDQLVADIRRDTLLHRNLSFNIMRDDLACRLLVESCVYPNPERKAEESRAARELADAMIDELVANPYVVKGPCP